MHSTGMGRTLHKPYSQFCSLYAGASGGRRRLQQTAALSPTAALTQLAAVQGPIFGVLSAAGAAMVVGETPAVVSGGTASASRPNMPF